MTQENETLRMIQTDLKAFADLQRPLIAC